MTSLLSPSARKRQQERNRRSQLRRRLGLLEPLEDRRVLATITVNALGDAVADDGNVTLREAIQAANTDTSVSGSNAGSGADRIVFSGGLSGETITLTGGEIAITDDVEIVGLGQSQLTVDAGSNSRIFNIDDGQASELSVMISDLTLSGGSASNALVGSAGDDGGAILTRENLTLTRTTLSGNTAVGIGGAIFSPSGSATLVDSTVSGNTAYAGGGVYGSATLNISGGSFSMNSAEYGGAIGSGGNLTVTNTGFTGNTSTQNGGTFYNSGTASINQSTITGSDSDGDGGAVYNNGSGTFTANSLSITGSTADGTGGAIHNAGTLNLTGSTLSGNTSNLYGGAIYNNANANITGTNFDLNGASYGGAISNKGGNLTLTRSSITGSTAVESGGAIYNDGSATIVNSTLAGNTASYYGGGLYNSGTATLTSSTISGNSASQSGGGLYSTGTATIEGSTIAGNTATLYGGGIFSTSDLTVTSSTIAGNSAGDSGGGIDNSDSATVFNSLIAGNTADGSADEISGVISGNFNLIGDAATGGGLLDGAGGNIVGVDWRVVIENDGTSPTLANNGGPNETIALLAGSPAFDTGNSALLPQDTRDLDGDGNTFEPLPVDGRGVLRVIDLQGVGTGIGLDIGAYEMIGLSIADGFANEADGTIDFAVTVDTPVPEGQIVSVQLDTSDIVGQATAGVDYTALTNFTIAFNETDPQTQIISVPLIDDLTVEGNETLRVTLSSAVGGFTNDTASGTILDDDLPGILFTPNENLTTTEAGGTAVVNVSLATEPTADVTFTLATSNASEGTVSTTELTFTTGNWNIPVPITVTGVDDGDLDRNVAYEIVTGPSQSTDPDYDGIALANIPLTNLDDEKGSVTITPVSLTTSESGTTATFNVSLDTAPLSEVTIGLSSSNVSEGILSVETLTFISTASQTVTVTGIDDGIADGDVDFSIITGLSSSLDTAFDGIDPADVTVTNTDDDVAGITVSPISGSTTEAGGTATFSVVLDSIPTSDVTIDLASTNLGEGTVSPSTLTFTAGNATSPQIVTVTGVDDNVDDGDVPFTVSVTPSSPDASYNAIPASSVDVTNIDDDTAAIFVSPTSGLTTTESGGTATFDVVLGTVPTNDVTIAITSSNTAEGTVSTSLLTFTPGDALDPQTVTVTGVDDAFNDGTISYTIQTAAAGSLDPNYDGIDPSDVSIANSSNDTAGITITPISGLVTTEAGGTATFSIALNTLPTSDVTISLASSNTGEGTVSDSLLTFNASNGTTPQFVTVTGVDEMIDDGDAMFTIITGDSQSSDTDYNGLTIADVSVTNVDDDTAGFIVSTDTVVVSESGTSAEVTVVLTSVPTMNVTLGFDNPRPLEASLSIGSFVFTPAEALIPQTLTITGLDDGFDDGDIAFLLATLPASSLDPSYNGLNPADIAVTTIDDDTANITLTVDPNFTVDENGNSTFTVQLDSVPLSDVTISLSSTDVGEGNVFPAELVFTPLAGITPQTVTVVGTNDDFDDEDGIYTIITGSSVSDDPLYSGINLPDVSVTTVDDDFAGVTITPLSGLVTSEAGGTATFSLVLDSQPTENVSIGLTSSNTDEGTVSASQVTFTPANWESPRTVTITGVDDQIADGLIGYAIITGDAVSDDPKYSGLVVDDVSAANSDNETPGVTVNPTLGLITTEAGRTATFEVSLDTPPAADVTISLTTSNPGEGTVSPAMLTFTPTNGTDTQTVTVTGVDDDELDGLVTYSIITGNAESGDPNYAGIDVDDVTVRNFDNDTAGITVDPTSGLTTNEAGGSATFTVRLNTIPTADVVIDLSSSLTTEGTVSPASLTFTRADGIAPQTVTVTGVDDTSFDGDALYTIITAAAVSDDGDYDGLDADDVSVTNQDNDVASTFDFGDAPDPTYATLQASDGARHTVAQVANPLRLGDSVDIDSEGQPSALAVGDGSDEDGVTFLSSIVSIASGASTASVLVNASASARLDAWIDFDGNGTFDSAEHLGGGTSIDVTAGDNIVAFTVPAGVQLGDTFARFRLSTAGNLLPTGAAADGEVEDYLVSVIDPSTSPVQINQSSTDLFVSVDGGAVVATQDGVEISRIPAGDVSEVLAIGTDGNDTLDIGDLGANPIPITYQAGTGNDTLRFSGEGLTLDLPTFTQNGGAGVEVFDIGGSGANQLSLDAASALALVANGDTLTILLDSDDTLDTGDGFELTGNEISVNDFFTVAENQGVTLRVRGPGWTNPINRFDVNGSTTVEPIDALQILNEISRGTFTLPNSTMLIDPVNVVEFPGRYFDVNRDGRVAPIDALQVINLIARGGEAEGEAPQGLPSIERTTDQADNDEETRDLVFSDLSPLEGSFAQAVNESVERIAATATLEPDDSEDEDSVAVDVALHELLRLN